MSDDTDTPDEADEQIDRPDYDTGRQDAVSSGAKIRGKVKRGEDTRDQDELVIEGRGATADEAIQDFEDSLTAAEERGWADRLRDLQPGDQDGDQDA